VESNSKVLIYKGIIQYLLESTRYTLKNIADLSDTSIKNIRSIYCDDQMPSNFSSELHLVKLYQLILELEKRKPEYNYSPHRGHSECE
jgi:hypothetical protein